MERRGQKKRNMMAIRPNLHVISPDSCGFKSIPATRLVASIPFKKGTRYLKRVQVAKNFSPSKRTISTRSTSSAKEPVTNTLEKTDNSKSAPLQKVGEVETRKKIMPKKELVESKNEPDTPKNETAASKREPAAKFNKEAYNSGAASVKKPSHLLNFLTLKEVDKLVTRKKPVVPKTVPDGNERVLVKEVGVMRKEPGVTSPDKQRREILAGEDRRGTLRRSGTSTNEKYTLKRDISAGTKKPKEMEKNVLKNETVERVVTLKERVPVEPRKQRTVSKKLPGEIGKDRYNSRKESHRLRSSLSKREEERYYEKKYGSSVSSKKRTSKRYDWSKEKQYDKNPYRWHRKDYGKARSSHHPKDFENLEDVSDAPLDEADFEEVEVASEEDPAKSSEVPIRFRRYKIKYLGVKGSGFFKPKRYSVRKKRIVVKCPNLVGKEIEKSNSGTDIHSESKQKSIGPLKRKNRDDDALADPPVSIEANYVGGKSENELEEEVENELREGENELQEEAENIEVEIGTEEEVENGAEDEVENGTEEEGENGVEQENDLEEIEIEQEEETGDDQEEEIVDDQVEEIEVDQEEIVDDLEEESFIVDESNNISKEDFENNTELFKSKSKKDCTSVIAVSETGNSDSSKNKNRSNSLVHAAKEMKLKKDESNSEIDHKSTPDLDSKPGSESFKGKKTVFVSPAKNQFFATKDFSQGPSVIQSYLDEWRSHLIGLEYVIEIQDKKEDTVAKEYYCGLCLNNVPADSASGKVLINHVISYKHMYNYMAKHFPSCGSKFLKKVGRSTSELVLQKCCEEINLKMGYQYMCITKEDYFQSHVKEIKEVLKNMLHWCETDVSIDPMKYKKDIVELDVPREVTGLVGELMESVGELVFPGTISTFITTRVENRRSTSYRNVHESKKNNTGLACAIEDSVSSSGRTLILLTPRPSDEISLPLFPTPGLSPTNTSLLLPSTPSSKVSSNLLEIQIHDTIGLPTMGESAADNASLGNSSEKIMCKQNPPTVVEKGVSKKLVYTADESESRLKSFRSVSKKASCRKYRSQVSPSVRVSSAAESETSQSVSTVRTVRMVSKGNSDLSKSSESVRQTLLEEEVTEEASEEPPLIDISEDDAEVLYEEDAEQSRDKVVSERSDDADFSKSKLKGKHQKTMHSKYCLKRILGRSISSKFAKDISIKEEALSDDCEMDRKEGSSVSKKMDLSGSNSSYSKRKSSTERVQHPIRVTSRTRSPYRRYSRSPHKKRSRSPKRHVSPNRRYSRSPVNQGRRRYSRSPVRGFSRSPIRRNSRSPNRRRSKSPRRRYSRSPLRRRSRSPGRRRSRSPFRKRSRSPFKRRSRSPLSTHSRSPFRKRSISPVKILSRSPQRSTARLRTRRSSRSPVRKISRSPTGSNSRRRASPTGSTSRLRASPTGSTSRYPTTFTGSRISLRRISKSPVKREARRPEKTLSGIHRYIDGSKPSSSHKEDHLRLSSHSHREEEARRSHIDLDPISDEDESAYFSTREGHMEEIRKLPEPTRKIIAQLLQKFSIADINTSDPSFNELMHFVNEHSSEIQHLMAQPPGFGSSIPINQDMNPIAQPRGAFLQQYLLSNLAESSGSRLVPPNMAYPSMPNVPSYPPHAPGISFPPPVPTPHSGPYPVPSFQQPNVQVGFSIPQRIPMPAVNPQQPFLTIPERHPQLPSNQFKQFLPQKQSLATPPKVHSSVFKDLKAKVNKLFGANEIFGPEPAMPSQPPNFAPAADSQWGPKQPETSQFHNNPPNYCEASIRSQDNFPVPYSNSNQEALFGNEESDKLSQQRLSVPPPDAKVSFCDAPRTPTKRNLFPVVSSNSGEMMQGPASSQSNVNEVKKSLAQRLASVLVKVGMLDVPAALLQEMLMKIGAFSSCPPQDTSENEILGILRKLGYIS